MTLDVAICTYRPEGITRVAGMILPPQHGIRYVVSWQCHGGAPLPPSLERDDVEVHRFDHSGLSLNRNNAFSHCRGDIILIADDDLRYTPDSLRAVTDAFESAPEVDVATFRCESTPATCIYPDKEVDLGLKMPKGYSVTSFEIALRRSTAGALRCHPLLGLGAPSIHCGEDEALLLTAIHRGLRCRFFPRTICVHDHPSTGVAARLSPGVLRGLGFVIALGYPATAILRVPLKAWRLSRQRRATLLTALRYVAAGALMAPLVRRRTRRYLW